MGGARLGFCRGVCPGLCCSGGPTLGQCQAPAPGKPPVVPLAPPSASPGLQAGSLRDFRHSGGRCVGMGTPVGPGQGHQRDQDGDAMGIGSSQGPGRRCCRETTGTGMETLQEWGHHRDRDTTGTGMEMLQGWGRQGQPRGRGGGPSPAPGSLCREGDQGHQGVWEAPGSLLPLPAPAQLSRLGIPRAGTPGCPAPCCPGDAAPTAAHR